MGWDRIEAIIIIGSTSVFVLPYCVRGFMDRLSSLLLLLVLLVCLPPNQEVQVAPAGLVSLVHLGP
jgi:hypothetical protein